MKRTGALMIAGLVALGPVAFAEESAEQQKKKETPTTYESPLLSLLFLPANVLIKMASVLTPQDSAKSSRENPRAADPGK